MSQPDRVEYYDGKQCLLGIESSIVPPVGSLISIRGATWEVTRATYAIDYADSHYQRQIRANVDLKAVQS